MAAAPARIVEEALEVDSRGVTLRGVIWRPASAEGPTPVVIVIAGSGPTDRDGNQQPGLDTDTYRMLAEALAREGIASIRYDKRGVGTSGRNFDAARVVLGDFTADAAAILARAREDERFSSVWLAGFFEWCEYLIKEQYGLFLWA